MLEPFIDDLWIDTRPQTFWGVETGSRMTVVRLKGGALFVHSPLGLDPETRGAVDALGEVVAVVAPSVFHHLHVPDWLAAYPKAVVAAVPGLQAKRPDVAFTDVLGDQAHPAWADEIDQVYFSARRENEVVFYHPRLRTLICADALINLGTHPNRATRLAARLMGNVAPGVGWVERFMVRDRGLARRQADRILAWEFDKAVLSHGDPVTERGGDVFRRAYAWL